MEDILFWIWLGRCCTPGSGTFELLRSHFGDAKEIYEAEEPALREALGRYDKDLKKLLNKDLEPAKRILHYCRMSGVRLMPYGSDEYPECLRGIPSPPVLLYYKGNFPSLKNRLAIGVVGTRTLSEYGKCMTFEIAHDLARAGVVVVSGLALGIDAVANAAAVNGGGETIAVLGSGIDIIYPPEHEKLASFVMRHGALVTEYPPGTRPEGKNFPVRNRIISGLSSALAVTEADMRSGALITARHAKKQGRPLYALPGRIGDEGSEGPCMLIKNGAKILTSADDILSDFQKSYPDTINIFKLLENSSYVIDKVLRAMRVSGKPRRKAKASLEDTAEVSLPSPVADEAPKLTPYEEEKTKLLLEKVGGRAEELYRLIPSSGSTSCDALAGHGIPITEAMGLLTQMELLGLVNLLPSGLVKRNHPQ